MIKVWHDEAWEEYLYWQNQDKKTIKKINILIKDIESNGAINGVGKPEALKWELAGCYSRRIDETNRLIYRISDGKLEIIKCKGHYDD
jgi:toxin YoeB